MSKPERYKCDIDTDVDCIHYNYSSSGTIQINNCFKCVIYIHWLRNRLNYIKEEDNSE